MKKIFIALLAVVVLLNLTGCDNKKEENSSNGNNASQKEEEKKNEENKQEENKQEENNNEGYIDDEIIDIEDEDDNNNYLNNEKVVVEEVINCDGCVYAYFSDDKSFGTTLSEGEYTTDITTLKTMGGKQRHNFFGLVLSENKISRAYACALKDNKIYCIEGSVDGRYHESNIGILNKIFTTDQCKYISDGHTYTCTDTNYNGDTITTGYASLHYETSCTIFGSEGKTGKMSCN